MLRFKANEKGFTLLELLIALALGTLIVISAFDIFLSERKARSAQDQLLEMEQNLRGGMDLLVKEVRMAGFGQPFWPSINGDTGINYTLRITDGGSNPDTLNMIGCFDEPSGSLAAAAVAGSTAITLQDATEAAKFNTTTKKEIWIGDLENAKITAISGVTLTVDTDPYASGNQGLINSYPASAPGNPVNVYLVKRITYTVDTTGNKLTRNENAGEGGQPVASNMVNLQITQSNPRATITLTARTRRGDPTHTDPVFGDGYRRRSLTMSIRVRNIP